MENQAALDIAAVPQIVVTQPSPLIHNTSIVSIAEKTGPTTEVTTVKAMDQSQNGTPEVQPTVVQVEPGTSSSDEFISMQECLEECAVPVPVKETNVEQSTTTASSEVDRDDFRTASTIRWCSFITACWMGYKRLWEVLDNRCRLPFWIIIMAIPLSAGVMGSLYMFSCPAASTLASAVFSLGLSLVAVLTIRICISMHGLLYNDNNFRQALKTMLLIAMFTTAMFFLTESAMFWQMDADSTPGSEKYCHPTFVKYTFWLNCFMWILMVLLIIVPA